MKTLFFSILLCVGLSANAQTIRPEKVPLAVKTAFSKNHPAAQKVIWELEKGNYESSFTLDKQDVSELYNKDGLLMESERKINQTLLPSGVLTYIKAHYKGAKIKETAKIVDSKGVIKYEAAIKGMDLIFDSKGNFLQEIKD